MPVDLKRTWLEELHTGHAQVDRVVSLLAKRGFRPVKAIGPGIQKAFTLQMRKNTVHGYENAVVQCDDTTDPSQGSVKHGRKIDDNSPGIPLLDYCRIIS